MNRIEELYISAERELADLTGWKSIRRGDYRPDGPLTGVPPTDESLSEIDCHRDDGRRDFPMACRSWEACGKLIGMHDVEIEKTSGGARAICEETTFDVLYDEHKDKCAALRYAIVMAIVCHLRR